MPTNRRRPPLAIDGGPPLRSKPFAPWPVFDEEMIDAAARVLRSGQVNCWTGDETRRFEREFADAVGARSAIALANGTVALELALHALGIGPGDEVVVPSRTFIASASCAAVRGAIPVVADVDTESGNITAETIAAVLTPRTKAIIAVHLAGWPCDLDPIMELARVRGLKVIEDCAQAHGATYHGRPVGSIGHAAAFSFCQDKILTTGGEGGMLTTNDSDVWARAWSYKDHGKSWDAVHAPASESLFRWLHAEFGTNWRLTEMQSAIGRVMLRRLPDWIATRRRNAARLTAALRHVSGVRVPVPPSDFGHSYYKHYALLDVSRLRHGWTRDRVLRAVQAEGVPCGSGSCSEIHRERAFATRGWGPPNQLESAARLGESSMMFLVHPGLTEVDMDDVAAALRKVLAVAQDSARADAA